MLIPRLSIIFCLSSGDIYLSLGISISFSFVTFSELFCCEFLKLLLFFDIPSLYYFNLSSRETCLSLGIFFIMLICNYLRIILLQNI